MSNLLKKLSNTSKSVAGHILSETDMFDKYPPIPTGVPVLNFALSGRFGGGLLPGTLEIAAKSKHFKTLYGLLLMKAFQKKYDDGAVVFYDSEFGSRPNYFENMGIDTSRVVWKPLNIVQRWTHDCFNVVESIEENEHAFIFVDSLGNMGSLKEVEDARDGKEVQDMTRAKAIKSAFRVLNLNAIMKGIPLVVINHTYDEQTMHGKQVASGGCLVPGSMVRMGDGTCKPIEDIRVGEMVMSASGCKSKVTHTWTPETLEEGEPECYEVTFDDGSVITCSENHRFMGLTGEWSYVTDISPGQSMLAMVYDTAPFDNVIVHVARDVETVIPVGRRKVYDLTVEGTNAYQTENGVLNHNTGIEYNSENIWIISRVQDKDQSTKELKGYNFKIKVEKSRAIREGKTFDINVSYETGIDRWTGLLPIALETGHVTKPSQGWYSRPSVPDDKKWRASEASCLDFWAPILKDPTFEEEARKIYCLVNNVLIDDGETEDMMHVADHKESFPEEESASD